MPIPDSIKENISIPVIGAPLFLISVPDLVIAQCKAGIIGSFPALNARPQHVLEEWIVRIKTELKEYQEQIKLETFNGYINNPNLVVGIKYEKYFN